MSLFVKESFSFECGWVVESKESKSSKESN